VEAANEAIILKLVEQRRSLSMNSQRIEEPLGILFDDGEPQQRALAGGRRGEKTAAPGD